MAGFTPLERKAARAHLARLAAKYGVQLVWVRSWGKAEAHVPSRIARIPRIESGRDYLVGLHEIGHCLQPTARRLHDRTDVGGQLLREAAAWAWAAEHCLPQLACALSQHDWQLVGGCFGSYIRWHALPEEGPATLDAPPGTAPANHLGD